MSTLCTALKPPMTRSPRLICKLPLVTTLHPRTRLRTRVRIFKRYQRHLLFMLCIASSICRAVSTRPLFLKGELRLARTIPLLQIFLHRKAKSADIGKQNWKKKPSPGEHIGDFGLDVIALALVGHREVDHGFEPGLGRPFVGWVGDTGLGNAF